MAAKRTISRGKSNKIPASVAAAIGIAEAATGSDGSRTPTTSTSPRSYLGSSQSTSAGGSLLMRLMFACAPLLDPVNRALMVPGFIGHLRPSCPAVVANGSQPKPASNAFTVEFLNDSGAGRTIISKRALKEQGVPSSAVDPYINNASQPISF